MNNDYIKMLQQANIKIAELEKRNTEILNRVAEAETRMLAAVLGSTGTIEDCKKSMEAHNLKQHSLAVNNFANKFCGDATTNYQVQLTIDAHCWCEMLDSKALKEGK
jgi:hypothetical protein